MLLKAFAVSLIILSIYFLGVILQRITTSSPEEKQGVSYHIGCYESQSNLNESKAIQQYLVNLSNEIAPFSISEIKKHQQRAAATKVDTDAANRLALEFKKYITAYQNIKNLNEYEQSYNRGMREAREEFLKCREDFLSQDWDCKGSYARYLETDKQFALIKSNLSVIIEQKYEQQHKIQKLLKTGQESNEEEYEDYRIKIQNLNKEIAKLQLSIRQKNETLVGLQNKEFKLIYDLNHTRTQVEECQRNKKELEICKVIIQRLKEVFTGVDLIDLQHKIETKRKIIQKYSSALVKSNKLGQDTTEIKAQISKNTFELNKLLELYSQTQVLSLCSGDFIKKCSDQHILELERNITNMEESLQNLRAFKVEIRQAITIGQLSITEIYQFKDKTTEDYQNTIGSIDKIRQTQAVSQKRLREYKQNINRYNEDIAAIQKNITHADINRRNAIYELDKIIGRVGGLAECLSKKEYLIKLQSKRPVRREQDQKLKREAAQTLIKVLRSAYK